MPAVSVIENMAKIIWALSNLHLFPGLILEISCTEGNKLLMRIKHTDFYVVCDFINGLYGADLVPDEWKGNV